jgi:hypothetical protein
LAAEQAAADEAARLAAEEAVRQLSEEAARISEPPPPPTYQPGYPEPTMPEPSAPPAPLYELAPSLDDLSEFASFQNDASAASMFSEVSAHPTEEPAVYVLEEEEPEVVEEEREPAFAGGMSDFADTASLMRELSSLGLEDDPSGGSGPSAPRAPSPRPGGSSHSATAAGKGKRKGLFGR